MRSVFPIMPLLAFSTAEFFDELSSDLSTSLLASLNDPTSNDAPGLGLFDTSGADAPNLSSLGDESYLLSLKDEPEKAPTGDETHPYCVPDLNPGGGSGLPDPVKNFPGWPTQCDDGGRHYSLCCLGESVLGTVPWAHKAVRTRTGCKGCTSLLSLPLKIHSCVLSIIIS